MTQTIIRRRTLLGAGAALAATSLAGCAGMSSSPSIGRVVVVGGGYGGATAARYLKLWGGNVEVTLVERNADFVSCPISNLVLGGFKQMSDITRSYDGLKAAGVKVVRGEARAVDVSGKKLRLADGSDLPYDRLVLSPGIDFMTEQIGGLGPALDSGRVLHSWKAGPQTVELRTKLELMRNGGVFVMAIPPMPFRCPPGPYERICQVASYLKEAKPRSKILVLDANQNIVSKGKLFTEAWGSLYKGLIEYRPQSKAVGIDARTRTVKGEFGDVRALYFGGDLEAAVPLTGQVAGRIDSVKDDYSAFVNADYAKAAAQ